MTSLRRTLFAVLTLLLVAGAAVCGEPTWTWIHGELADPEAQQSYLEFARRIHTYYQDHGMMPGPLVAEQECDPWPEDHVVFLGPLAAFSDPARFGLPITVEGETVSLGAQPLSGPRLGIFLTDEAETRVLYSGLSFEGFGDIFTVPTGRHRCTVTGGKGQVLYETDDLAEVRDLEDLPFLHPLPGPEEVAEFQAPPGALGLAPVATDAALTALDPAFAGWLDGFVRGRRVLFFGESHWSQGVNRLFQLMVLHLLETSDVRSVFLEMNYSFGGYFNHYVTERDADQARTLLSERLHHLVASQGTMEFLEALRRWNLAHPDQPVRVGCLDMEWSRQRVAAHIIQPYFRRLDPDFFLDWEQDDMRVRTQELLDEARARNLVGEYSFITPAYMATVLTNLWDTMDLEDFNVDRQRGIIRNITEFNGSLLGEGLAVFKGGGWHAVKTRREGEDFLRDAAYLQLEHPPTRGKVVTLMARGLGCSFADIVGVNLATRMASATNYNRLVTDFQQALAGGRADAEAHYLLDHARLGVFDRLVIARAYATGLNAVHVAQVDWAALESVWGEELSPREARDCDAAVFIVRDKLELMRPVQLGR